MTNVDDVPLFCKVRVVTPENTIPVRYFEGDVGTYIGRGFFDEDLYRIQIPGCKEICPMWRREFEVIDYE